MMWAGIDYGSKLAGTTAICVGESIQKKKILCSKKKADADEFVWEIIQQHPIDFICLDAPLSLPGLYTHGTTHYSNYFYRESDIITKAMSPLFLGGLTARAIQLKDRLKSHDVAVFESYPAAFVTHIELQHVYQKKELHTIQPFMASLKKKVGPIGLKTQPQSWHDVDAILCWIIGLRIQSGVAQRVGNEQEGYIYF